MRQPPRKGGMKRGLLRSARETRANVATAGALEEAPMAIVAGFDVHRAQITFDALDQQTGELERGRMRATPEAVREWAGGLGGRELHVAVEACTGWLFVCEALVEAGAIPHLAEPVETSALRGKKRRAKTDREDARWLRTLLCDGRLPEGLDPADARAGVAHPRAAAQDAGRRAHELAAASSSDAVPPRRRGRAGQAAERPGARLPRPTRAARRRPRAGRGGAGDDRGARPPARPARAGVAPAGPPPDRLPGADAPLRDRRADRADDRLRARRRDAPVGVAQGGALRRPRCRRAPLRPPLPRGQANQAGIAAAALGALRVSPSGLQTQQSRPRRLPGAQGARALAH